jgi:hypothetical protein
LICSAIRMSPYERANLIISVVALVISVIAAAVSILTLYFTFFHKRAQLVGALVLVDESARGAFDIEMEYVLCNTGNVQLLLKQITARVPVLSTDKKSTAFGVLESECMIGLPVIIEPQNTKLIKVRVKKDDLRTAREHNERCFVVFELISSRGKFYEARHEYTKLEVQPEPKVPGQPLAVWHEPEVWKLFKLKGAN